MEKKIKKVFLESAESSTIHGVSRLFNGEISTPVRILRAITFISSLTFFCYLLISNVCDYNQFRTVTDFRLVDSRPMPFPKITFCINSPFTTNFSQEFYNTQVLPMTSENLTETLNLNLPYVIAFSLNQTDKEKLSYKMEVT